MRRGLKLGQFQTIRDVFICRARLPDEKGTEILSGDETIRDFITAERGSPILGGHLKTGQSGTPENRPVKRIQDNSDFYLTGTLLATVFRF